MKFNTLKIAAAIAVLPSLATAGVTITPMATYQTFDNIAKDTVIPQLGLGYRFDNLPIALDLVVGGGSTDLVRSAGNRYTNQSLNGNENNLKSTDILEYSVDAKYFLPKLGALPLEFYGAAGVGQIMLDGAEAGSVEALKDDKKGAYIKMNAGLGAQYGLTDNLNAVADARYVHWAMGTGVKGAADNEIDDMQLSLGLQYDFGKKAVPLPPVVKPVTPVVSKRIDSDKDGVIDKLDKCPGTPRNYAVDARGCPMKRTKVVSIPLRVLFDTNKSFVKPQYQSELAKAANFMKKHPESTTVIEGYTDSRGSAKYNQRLSQRRANSVKMNLASKHGINPARLRAVGYGEARPVAPNNTKAGRAQNRRVVAVITAKEQIIKQR